MTDSKNSQGSSKPVVTNESLSAIAKIRPEAATASSTGSGQATDQGNKK